MEPLPENLFQSSTDLVAAIVQEADTGQVLMLAWMNREALTLTMETKMATYWSRSRSEIWIKGATSGNIQEVQSIALDCDSDALLLKVKQTGPACHTGEVTCFHRRLMTGSMD